MRWCKKCMKWKNKVEFNTKQHRCKLCQKQYNEKYYGSHKDYHREYYKKHKRKIKERKKEYGKKYYKKNKERLKKYQVEYLLKKYKTSPKERINRSIAGLMRYSLRNNKNGRHWESLVDFTQNDLMKHLENKFSTGMTWANYGKWHIDHKVPISVFNFDSPDQLDFKKCWALSNLQPMWAKENISKHNKISKPFQPSLKI